MSQMNHIVWALLMLVLNQTGGLTDRTKKTSDRKVLLGLVKSLSSSFQRSLAFNAVRMDQVVKDMKNMTADMETFQEDFKLLVSEVNGKTKNRLDKMDLVLNTIQNDRKLDSMLWKFNTEVCNASLFTLRKDLQGKLTEIENSIGDKRESEQLTDVYDFLSNEKSPEDILKQFESAYTDYYEEKGEKVIEKEPVKDPVTTLVLRTNKMLEELEKKYINISNGIKTRESTNKHDLQSLEDKITKTMFISYKSEADTMNKRINQMEGHTRKELELRGESMSVLEKTVMSRLSVYEARLNLMEEMIMETRVPTTEASIGTILLNPATPRPYSSTTEYSMANFDFSMLGINSPEELDRMEFGKYQVGETNNEPTNEEAIQDLSSECDCQPLKERLADLELQLLTFKSEMGTAVEGLRGSISVVNRRMEQVERTGGRTKCVATKEAANMPGMDSWCAENCAKDKCPSHLCSCPTIKDL